MIQLFYTTSKGFDKFGTVLRCEKVHLRRNMFFSRGYVGMSKKKETLTKKMKFNSILSSLLNFTDMLQQLHGRHIRLGGSSRWVRITPFYKPWSSAIWKGSHNPILRDLRSPWLLTTETSTGIILQVSILHCYT